MNPDFISDEWDETWKNVTSSDVAQAIFPVKLTVSVDTDNPKAHHYTGLVDQVVNDVDEHFGLALSYPKVEWKCINVSPDKQKKKIAAKKKRLDKLALSEKTAAVKTSGAVELLEIVPPPLTRSAASRSHGSRGSKPKAKVTTTPTTIPGPPLPKKKTKEALFMPNDHRFTVPAMRYETSHKTVRFYCTRCKEKEICSLVAFGTITFSAPLLELKLDHLYFHDQVCEGVDNESRHNINQPALKATKMCLIPFPVKTRERLFGKTYDAYLELIDSTPNLEVQSIPEGQWINFGNEDNLFEDRHYTPLPGKKLEIGKQEHLTSMIGLVYHMAAFLSIALEVAPFLNDLDACISSTSGQFVGKTVDKPNLEVHLCLEGESIIYGGARHGTQWSLRPPVGSQRS